MTYWNVLEPDFQASQRMLSICLNWCSPPALSSDHQIEKTPKTRAATTITKEQLLYELHDPSRYLTPDVTADFRDVRLEQRGPDAVAVSGGTGAARPEKLKVTLGYHEGYMGEGQISYAGPGCVARGQLALGIIEERLKRLAAEIVDLRLDLIGVNAIAPAAKP